MTARARILPIPKIIGLLVVLATAAMPGHAADAPQARLVHCGEQTCLRISGRRPRPTIAIRIGQHDIAVEGGRSWHATLPLATARMWAHPSGDALTVTLADGQDASERTVDVLLPPGALGSRVELAALTIHAR